MILKKTYLIAITALVSAQYATAYDFISNNSDSKAIYYNKTGSNTVEVTYKDRFRATESYDGRLEIPEKITVGGVSYTVTGIGDNALFNCRSLTSVTIPNTVVSIGTRTFAWCDAISEISIPQNVKMIGSNTFDGCYALERITVNKGNKTYDDDSGVLFTDNMAKLISYTPATEGEYKVPDGVEEIGDNAFAACTFLTDVRLPESVRVIGDNAFYFCNFLDGITIPRNVTKIGRAAFADCLSLRYIDVDKSNAVYASADGVLYDKGFKTLIQHPGAVAGMAKIQSGVTTIGEQAFFRNYTLTTVKLPTSVTEVGEAAFIDCPKLASIEIPTSVKKIGPMALAMCQSLSSIYVFAEKPEDLTLGDNVFFDVNPMTCTLYVPKGSVDLYAQAPQWRDFANIVGTEGLKSQIIKWEQSTDTLMTNSKLRLTAQSSSKLPIHYVLDSKSQELATIDDRYLLINAPGVINVTAYQPGNIAYKPAPSVTHTFIAKLSGLDEVTDDIIKVYGSFGAIVIKGADDEAPAYIYDTAGIELYHGIDRYIPVQPGCIYLVRISGKSYKVAVR